jgi:hypothetical protein
VLGGTKAPRQSAWPPKKIHKYWAGRLLATNLVRGQFRLERLQLGGPLRGLRLAAPLLLLLGLALALQARAARLRAQNVSWHACTSLAVLSCAGLGGAAPAPLRPCKLRACTLSVSGPCTYLGSCRDTVHCAC